MYPNGMPRVGTCAAAAAKALAAVMTTLPTMVEASPEPIAVAGEADTMTDCPSAEPRPTAGVAGGAPEDDTETADATPITIADTAVTLKAAAAGDAVADPAAFDAGGATATVAAALPLLTADEAEAAGIVLTELAVPVPGDAPVGMVTEALDPSEAPVAVAVIGLALTAVATTGADAVPVAVALGATWTPGPVADAAADGAVAVTTAAVEMVGLLARQLPFADPAVTVA